MVDNVQIFSHFHLKYAKSAMTKNFFSLKISYGYQKTQNFMPISNSLTPAFRNAPNKLKAKNNEKMHKHENIPNSHSFLALAFFRGLCLSRHQRI
jgi:hypothetical protein